MRTGFYDVDLGIVDSDNAGLKLMAIGDVDSDGFADLITINAQEDSFLVHFFDPTARKFVPASSPVYIDGGQAPKIANIVISRNMEVEQSLYVIYYKDGGKSDTFLRVFKQVSRGKFVQSSRSQANGWQLYPNSQPMFFDINGDMK